MKLLSALTIFFLSIAAAVSAPIKVGVTAGPHAMIMEKVKEMAKVQGLDVQIVEFSDFVTPNIALNDKAIDLNSYQHQPYLDDQIKTRGYKFKSAGKTVLMPLGIYSKKIKALKDLKDQAKIAIPNDPTNGGRALKLLEKEGLIKLKPSENPTILDVSENLRKFSIIEIEAPQVPRTLDDVEIAIINTDWVVMAGLDPKSALAREEKDSPYANVIAIRTDENRPEIAQLVEIYHSKQLKDFINTQFKGAAIPAW